MRRAGSYTPQGTSHQKLTGTITTTQSTADRSSSRARPNTYRPSASGQPQRGPTSARAEAYPAIGQDGDASPAPEADAQDEDSADEDTLMESLELHTSGASKFVARRCPAVEDLTSRRAAIAGGACSVPREPETCVAHHIRWSPSPLPSKLVQLREPVEHLQSNARRNLTIVLFISAFRTRMPFATVRQSSSLWCCSVLQ